MSEPIKKYRLSNILVFVAILSLAGYWVPAHFSVTLTPSLTKRVFFLKNNPNLQSVKKGDYVMFVVKSDDFIEKAIEKAKTNKTIKIVGCAAGNILKVVNKDYYCDNVYLGKAKDASLEGVPVNNFVFNGPVPAGELFLIGQHKDSYDSRYFGFISVGNVISQAYPIF